MELNFIEESDNLAKVEIKGENHTFCNILRKELWNDKNVKVAGYDIKRGLTDSPVLIIETNGKEKPRQVLKKSIQRLKKDLDEFKKEIKKIK